MGRDRELFEIAFNTLLLDEGGLSDDPDDPGGLTKYGISKRYYPDLDIKNLTVDDARELFWKDWWVRYRYKDLAEYNFDIAERVFNIAVNIGPDSAAKYLQIAINSVIMYLGESKRLDCLVVDGIIGSVTIRTLSELDFFQTSYILPAFTSLVAHHYMTRPKRDKYESGWMNRLYRHTMIE